MFCTIGGKLSSIFELHSKHEKSLYRTRFYIQKPLVPYPGRYLSDRFFRVKFIEETSELHPVRGDDPQGSMLGPTLYTIYIEDLPLIQADDIVIISYHSLSSGK